MDNISASTPFRFEALPDEILLEIFKYIQPIDLRSFVGHNLRIDNALQDVKLNIVIQYPEDEEDLDYLTCFLPSQFIRLELRYGWEAFDMNVLKELRSLILDCTWLSDDQFNQVLTVNLPYLERFSIDNIPHYYGETLLLSVLDNEHFPSLKICQFSSEFHYMLKLNDHVQLPNNTIRTLILKRWYGPQLGSILNLLPNLHRFETKFEESFDKSQDFNIPHMSLTHLRVKLKKPSNDLDEILRYMPNLKRLHVTGMITEDSALEHIQQLAKIFCTHTPGLQQFDCQLYFHTENAWDCEDDIVDIQQLHPLFNMIQCHVGKSINRCYATDLKEYPSFSEYTFVESPVSYPTTLSGVMNGYDSDRDYSNDDDDYNNGWIDYGLGYRGNYKANYGSSPWDGNNDDD